MKKKKNRVTPGRYPANMSIFFEESRTLKSTKPKGTCQQKPTVR